MYSKNTTNHRHQCTFANLFFRTAEVTPADQNGSLNDCRFGNVKCQLVVPSCWYIQCSRVSDTLFHLETLETFMF